MSRILEPSTVGEPEIAVKIDCWDPPVFFGISKWIPGTVYVWIKRFAGRRVLLEVSPM